VRGYLLMGLVLAAPLLAAAAPPPAALPGEVVSQVVARLVERFGEGQAARIRRGVEQVAVRWRPADGDAAAFAAFCEANFVAEEATLRREWQRLEAALEQVEGHLHEVQRELRRPLDLDLGPLGAVDRMLAEVDLAAHLQEDLFRSKVAFFALLNFPVHTLAERRAAGPGWDREAWARSRMMDRFAERIPPELLQGVTAAITAANRYVAEYNIRMDRLVTGDGRRLFPDGLRLLSHWGLRDELKAAYREADPLPRQRLIQRVFERIVRQEIPAAVVDNPELEWCPDTNLARAAGQGDPWRPLPREEDVRFRHMLAVFQALAALDPYTPTAPSAIARAFEQQRQMPEPEVEGLLVSVLTSEEVRRTAEVVARRLGRPLEPFDIWYDGFRTTGGPPQEVLDRLVAARYPTAAAFQQDLPGILARLGFSGEQVAFLAPRIVVDPARGSGHAMGAVRREDAAHLRTRIGPSGMDYKGFNIAIHELGHNVEQVFSLNGIDHWFLAGVPNSAFTEALAFVFQRRDLGLLGVTGGGPAAEDALAALWSTYEIAGVGLVDMGVWHWLYEHPGATPAELREAVLSIARDVWNRYYAPLFGTRDSVLLAVYSHMIDYPLYLPDYALGHIVAAQVAEALQQGDFGRQVERLMRLGNLTPDAWMRAAVGEGVSAAALLRNARAALETVR